MARKKAQAFRTITEVSDWLDTPSHVLRFWESKFSQIKPVKRAGGRRYYRPEDLKLIGGIKHLLHDKGTTIAAVKEMIKTDGEEHIHSFSPEPNFPEKGRRKLRKAKAEKARADAKEATTDKQESVKVPATETAPEPDVRIDSAEPETQEPLVLNPHIPDEQPMAPSMDTLKPEPIAPLTLTKPTPKKETELRENSARDFISNAVNRTTPEETMHNGASSTEDAAVIHRSSDILGSIKSRHDCTDSQILEVEELYFELQRIRNRMKRRLQTISA